jgi:nucleoside permease NupC
MEIIVAFIIVVIAVTFALNRLIRRSVVTVIISVVTCVIGFQLISYINLGYLDPFYLIASGVQVLTGLVVAVATIAVPKLLRRGK